MARQDDGWDNDDDGVGPALGEPLDPKTGHSSFRRPCFQRGELREKSQFPAGPTFPPEIWQKDLIEPACLAYVPTLDTFKVGDIEGPARKFRTLLLLLVRLSCCRFVKRSNAHLRHVILRGRGSTKIMIEPAQQPFNVQGASC